MITPLLYGLLGNISTVSQCSTPGHLTDFAYKIITWYDTVDQDWRYWVQRSPDGTVLRFCNELGEDGTFYRTACGDAAMTISSFGKSNGYDVGLKYRVRGVLHRTDGEKG